MYPPYVHTHTHSPQRMHADVRMRLQKRVATVLRTVDSARRDPLQAKRTLVEDRRTKELKTLKTLKTQDGEDAGRRGGAAGLGETAHPCGKKRSKEEEGEEVVAITAEVQKCRSAAAAWKGGGAGGAGGGGGSEDLGCQSNSDRTGQDRTGQDLDSTSRRSLEAVANISFVFTSHPHSAIPVLRST